MSGKHTLSTRSRSLAGKLGSTMRHHPDADVSDIRRELAAARIQDRIEEVLADAPPLTAAQIDRLTVIMHGGASE